MALFACKDLLGVEASFMDALAIQPDYFPALLSLAEFLVDRKRFQEALPYRHQGYPLPDKNPA